MADFAKRLIVGLAVHLCSRTVRELKEAYELTDEDISSYTDEEMRIDTVHYLLQNEESGWFEVYVLYSTLF